MRLTQANKGYTSVLARTDESGGAVSPDSLLTIESLL